MLFFKKHYPFLELEMVPSWWIDNFHEKSQNFIHWNWSFKYMFYFLNITKYGIIIFIIRNISRYLVRIALPFYKLIVILTLCFTVEVIYLDNITFDYWVWYVGRGCFISKKYCLLELIKKTFWASRKVPFFTNRIISLPWIFYDNILLHI